MSHTVDLGAQTVAQAIFGPLHRHLSLVQEAFRDPRAPRGAPAYSVTVHAQGNSVVLCGAPDAAEDLRRAIAIFDALILHFRNKQRLREGEVLAAIAFSQRGPEPSKGPLDLPQLGGLTLRTPRQLHYVEALRDPSLDLIFGVGPAGTGKTFLAVAVAVEALKQEAVDRIVVTRPAVEAGERLGFLPGDLSEKVDPYLQPIWDAFRSQMGEGDLKVRRERRQIEVAPLAFMRGRTLSNAFVIVDEAQNATILQMKMVLTRLGEGSRMVVTGDPTQVDLPRSDMSGLSHALSILDGVEGVETIRFGAQDVVRHRLVARIIQAYDHDENRRRGREPSDG
ncbi:MAG: PhoH family protein [Alphaproteobacteria bacterium]|nr:PhoH family protein [Alphaproteobacteria bacterium]